MDILPRTTGPEYQALITAKVAELRKLPCFRTNGQGSRERPYDVSGPTRSFEAFMASFERKGGKR